MVLIGLPLLHMLKFPSYGDPFGGVKKLYPTLILRCISDALPTRHTIHQRMKGVDYHCPISSCFPETTDHLLLYSNFARAVWFACPLGVRLPTALSHI